MSATSLAPGAAGPTAEAVLQDAILTSASVHDSQVAIPLMTLSGQRVDYLYELMDSAYVANHIHAHSRKLNHVAIIEGNAGKPIYQMPRATVVRVLVLNHLIHHRGQLSVYLRQTGALVPSIYGPSADEGQMGASA